MSDEIPVPAVFALCVLSGFLSCFCGANYQADSVCADDCKAQGYADGESPWRRIGDVRDLCDCIDEQRPAEKDQP
jgi:hypothetical protein